MEARFFTVVLGLALLVGCTDVDDGGDEQFDLAVGSELGANTPAPKAVVGYPLPDAASCSSGNVIGILNPIDGRYPPSCDLPGVGLPGTWVWHDMFETMTPDLMGWGEVRPEGLNSFCSFEFVGTDIGNPEQGYVALFNAIDAYPGMDISTVAVDCRGEVYQGDGLNDASVSQALAESFLTSIEAVSSPTIGMTQGNRSFPRVAVLDSVPSGPSPTPVNEHGLQMADIIGRVTCPGDEPDCLDSIVHYVAMPRDEYEAADYNKGGEFGTMGDLAAAIVASVGQWREDQLYDPKAPRNLIINLSLGWVPEDPTGTTTDPNRGPVRALQAALDFAACNGVVIFAAAGNVSEPACPGNAEEIGPLAPAIAGDQLAPDSAACQALGFADVNNAYPDYGKHSLVWPVAGLTGAGTPIANHRLHALAPLGAHASDVTVMRPDSSYSDTLTGTSNAAAVASATAALVWSYNPGMTPEDLYSTLYASGVDTGMFSDFGTWDGTSIPVHRLSVCGALEEACVGLPAGHCPALACLQAPAPVDAHLGGYFSTVNAILDDPGTSISRFDMSSEEPKEPICDPLTWTEQIRPQPEHEWCQHCLLDLTSSGGASTDLLEVQVNNMAGVVDHMILKTRTPLGFVQLIIDDPTIIASVNDPTTITEIEVNTSGSSYAVLTFVEDVTGAQQDGPIPVLNN